VSGDGKRRVSPTSGTDEVLAQGARVHKKRSFASLAVYWSM
jgi:hypothetical protein